ncbi:uncharacterized protein [Physcomitrium patens]|uniref:Uncharacterized protein n=2 Tax=Physcomitrium patens TaxID=3218 RepID=A0A7I4CNE2_PHYPA|nr:uncharacterized protein LOC112276578 isoform X1 [Physcomitrium patens]|eukprot:XP_024363761.1 uncharacterized protein LOC112276578 isoform X1 [Physcomitrella patens]
MSWHRSCSSKSPISFHLRGLCHPQLLFSILASDPSVFHKVSQNQGRFARPFFRGIVLIFSRTILMAPCLCSPTNHQGSFRCRLHRGARQSAAIDSSSWTARSRSSATVPCLCAPTSHVGSFRCRFHRNKETSWGGRPLRHSPKSKILASSESFAAKLKSGDTAGLKMNVRMNRPFSEAKLRNEQTKVQPQITAAAEDLGIMSVKMCVLKVVQDHLL